MLTFRKTCSRKNSYTPTRMPEYTQWRRHAGTRPRYSRRKPSSLTIPTPVATRPRYATPGRGPAVVREKRAQNSLRQQTEALPDSPDSPCACKRVLIMSKGNVTAAEQRHSSEAQSKSSKPRRNSPGSRVQSPSAAQDDSADRVYVT